MPVLDALPHLTIILDLKGILDFYYWKGVPCVRKWPHIPYSRRSSASIASAHLFGAIVAAYALLGAILKDLFALDAADQTRTARDLFVSAVLGRLHDHNMSDFLDLLTEATAYLAILKDLTNALNAIGTDQLRVKPALLNTDWHPLLVDTDRHLAVDILESALPTNAADNARQDTMITALQLIDDLRAALETVHTDRLLVRGMDQLWTIHSIAAYSATSTVSGVDGWCDSEPCPAGAYWLITNMAVRDVTSATTAHVYQLRHAGTNHVMKVDIAARAAAEWSSWQGTVHLGPGDTIRVGFGGAQVGDGCVIVTTGYQMTLET